jgi:hypothetical protein
VARLQVVDKESAQVVVGTFEVACSCHSESLARMEGSIDEETEGVGAILREGGQGGREQSHAHILHVQSLCAFRETGVEGTRVDNRHTHIGRVEGGQSTHGRVEALHLEFVHLVLDQGLGSDVGQEQELSTVSGQHVEELHSASE